MRNMIIIMQQFLRGVFLSKETSQQIHDIRNEYTSKVMRSITSTVKAKKDIEKTSSYKIGLAAGRYK